MKVKAELEIEGGRFWLVAPDASPPEGALNYIVADRTDRPGDLYLNGKRVGTGLIRSQDIEFVHAYGGPSQGVVMSTTIDAILEF